MSNMEAKRMIARIGIDIAKNVFHVHGVCAAGKQLASRKLRRSQVLAFFGKLDPCLVGMEACATSHYWAREIAALGHEVRLMPPKYVKAYLKRQKNDAADAAAICEAVGRPDMRFVPVKSRDQQAVLMLHRARDLLIRQRTMLINAFRAHLAETGHVAGLGRTGVTELLGVVEADDDRLTPLEREALSHLAGQIRDTADRITALERRILAWHRSSEASRRLETIPGVGPITASVIVASIGDGTTFRNARQFAAWLGLVPRQNSTGGKTRLGHITKWGDSYIRRLLVVSSCALIRYARAKPADENWLANVLSRRPAKVAAVAMANKTARIVWAVLVSGRLYQQEQPAAAT